MAILRTFFAYGGLIWATLSVKNDLCHLFFVSLGVLLFLVDTKYSFRDVFTNTDGS